MFPAMHGGRKTGFLVESFIWAALSRLNSLRGHKPTKLDIQRMDSNYMVDRMKLGQFATPGVIVLYENVNLIPRIVWDTVIPKRN